MRCELEAFLVFLNVCVGGGALGVSAAREAFSCSWAEAVMVDAYGNNL